MPSISSFSVVEYTMPTSPQPQGMFPIEWLYTFGNFLHPVGLIRIVNELVASDTSRRQSRI